VFNSIFHTFVPLIKRILLLTYYNKATSITPKFKYYFLTLIFILVGINKSIAQEEQQVELIIQKLHSLFRESLSDDKIAMNNNFDSTFLVSLSELKNYSNVNNNYSFNDYYRSKIDLIKSDIGLNFTADGLQNFSATQLDLDDNILYQRRYQSGFEWNILENGYFDRNNKLKQLENEQIIEQQLIYYKTLKENNNIKLNQCIYWFNASKIKLLEKRNSILKEQFKLIEKLYYLKKISKETLLKNQTKQAEINGLFSIYKSYNQYLIPIFDSTVLTLPFPLFDLKYDLILTQINDNLQLDSISQILYDNIENSHKWFSNIKLKGYFRYNYYDLMTSNPDARSFFNVGANLSLPIPLNFKAQNQFEKQKINKQLSQLNQSIQQKKIEILNETYEFRFQLKQYITFHQKKILNNERLRQEKVKAKLLDADFNPINAIDLLDEKYQIDIALLDIKQNLYIKLLKIQELLAQYEMKDILVPINLPNYFDFENEIERNCYIWSKTFENHTVEFLSEYLLYNKFDEVQIAVGKEDKFLPNKLKLIDLLYSENIKIDLMFGQNELLNSSNFQNEIEKILNQYPIAKLNGLHLDIEPHTRPDWKFNKAELQQKFIEFVKVTKSIANTYKIKLSIDLPLSSDTNFVNELFKTVDIIRFMCYENVKEEYIKRKLNIYNEKDKIALSFRTEDFKNRNELEEFAKKMVTDLKINNLNLHDLNRLIDMDKKSLIPNEKY
jgi:hypothetical protein